MCCPGHWNSLSQTRIKNKSMEEMLLRTSKIFQMTLCVSSPPFSSPSPSLFIFLTHVVQYLLPS